MFNMCSLCIKLLRVCKDESTKLSFLIVLIAVEHLSLFIDGFVMVQHKCSAFE